MSIAENSAVDTLARSIHRRTLVLDSHVDVLVSTSHPRLRLENGGSHTDLHRLQAGGIGAVVLSVAAQTGPDTAAGQAAALNEAEEKLAEIRRLVQSSDGALVIADDADEVRRIHRDGHIAAVIGFQNAFALGADLAKIDDFIARGVRVFALTHAGNNAFADSSRPGEETHGGLSALGLAAVDRLNALGVLIDVSQLSSNSYAQLLARTRAPVVASHSGVRALSDSPRNVSDEELDALKANGGVLQVTAFNNHLVPRPEGYLDSVEALRIQFGLSQDGPRHVLYRGYEALSADDRDAFFDALGALYPAANVETLVDHIDYAVGRIGIDHVGIGTDFNHGAGIAGFGSLAEAENVTRALVARGYDESDVGKIWSGNFLRVLETARAAATASLEVGEAL